MASALMVIGVSAWYPDRSIFDIFDVDSITFKENENDISDIFDMSHTLYSVQITL